MPESPNAWQDLIGPSARGWDWCSQKLLAVRTTFATDTHLVGIVGMRTVHTEVIDFV